MSDLPLITFAFMISIQNTLTCYKKVNHIEKKQNSGVIPNLSPLHLSLFTLVGSAADTLRRTALNYSLPPLQLPATVPPSIHFHLPFQELVHLFVQPGVTLRRSLKCHINTKHYIMRSNFLKMYPQAGLPTLFAAAALILRGQSCSSVTLQSNASCRRPLTLVVLPRLHTTTTTTTTGLAWLQ